MGLLLCFCVLWFAGVLLFEWWINRPGLLSVRLLVLNLHSLVLLCGYVVGVETRLSLVSHGLRPHWFKHLCVVHKHRAVCVLLFLINRLLSFVFFLSYVLLNEWGTEIGISSTHWLLRLFLLYRTLILIYLTKTRPHLFHLVLSWLLRLCILNFVNSLRLNFVSVWIWFLGLLLYFWVLWFAGVLLFEWWINRPGLLSVRLLVLNLHSLVLLCGYVVGVETRLSLVSHGLRPHWFKHLCVVHKHRAVCVLLFLINRLLSFVFFLSYVLLNERGTEIGISSTHWLLSYFLM